MMSPSEIRDHFKEKHGIELEWLEGEKGSGDSWCIVDAAQWLAACRLARDDDELTFDFLRSLAGVDRPDDKQIELVAHLFSYKKRHAFVLKTRLARDNPSAPSLSGVWPAAEWYERECFDLLGVNFEDHPDLRRIMLPDDWEGHPLRKDYEQKPEYRGIPTTRPGYGDAGEGK